MKNTNIGMIGCWLIDEGTGDKVKDSSGQGNDGTRGGLKEGSVPQWINDGPLRPNRPALRFDGTQFIEVKRNLTILEPCVVTVEARVRSRLPRRGGNAYVLSKGAEGCHFPSYGLITHKESEENGGLFFLIKSGTFHLSPGAHRSIWSGAAPPQWHHVAGVFDGRRLSLFVDGKSVGPSQPIDDTFINYKVRTHPRFYIGMYRGDEGSVETACDFGFRGDICDVRIWRGALSPVEIRQRSMGKELP